MALALEGLIRANCIVFFVLTHGMLYTGSKETSLTGRLHHSLQDTSKPFQYLENMNRTISHILLSKMVLKNKKLNRCGN